MEQAADGLASIEDRKAAAVMAERAADAACSDCRTSQTLVPQVTPCMRLAMGPSLFIVSSSALTPACLQPIMQLSPMLFVCVGMLPLWSKLKSKRYRQLS